MNLNNPIPSAPSLFLQWLGCQPPRTVAQIRFACQNMATGYGTDSKGAFYRIFMPLFRMGLVEFAGNGTYQLSPPAFLTGKGGRATAINPGRVLKAKLFSEYGADEPLLNLLHFSCPVATLRRLAWDHTTPILNVDTRTLLARFPDVGAVVSHWTVAPLLFPQKHFYQPLAYSWTEEPCPFGLFKPSAVAKNYYFLDPNGNIRPVPPPAVNPDGFAIAVAWQTSLMEANYLHHDPATQQLRVSRLRLPALLERVLRIRSLSATTAWPEDQPETIITDISREDHLAVVRILCQNN
jgi:hypothetical protein